VVNPGVEDKVLLLKPFDQKYSANPDWVVSVATSPLHMLDGPEREMTGV
jgi:hypothetical protein